MNSMHVFIWTPSSFNGEKLLLILDYRRKSLGSCSGPAQWIGHRAISVRHREAGIEMPYKEHMSYVHLGLFCVCVCVCWRHVTNLSFLLLQCWEKTLMMGEHPWLVILTRQRSRFTLLIQSILCWRVGGLLSSHMGLSGIQTVGI